MTAAFQCKRCGNCCRAEGYVRLRQGEVEAISAELGLPVSEFTAGYTRLTDDRRGLSLTEKPDGSCVFLLDEDGCRIEHVKPAQCRDFPLRWAFDGYEDICAAEKEKRESE